MTKWADFGISGVRFNSTHAHIEQVQINQDNGDSLGNAVVAGRLDIVNAIRRGKTFVTIFRTSEAKWNKGQPVFIDRVGGIDYLKTVPNGKPIDNLDNLPEF